MTTVTLDAAFDAAEHAIDAALEECARQGCPAQVLQEAKTAGLLAAKTALGIPASDAYSGVKPEPAPVKPKVWTRLTLAQREELTRQRDEGPQHTYGAGRARVQNNLVSMKLSQFLDEFGHSTRRWSLFLAMGDNPNSPSTCVITDAGRRALEEEE